MSKINKNMDADELYKMLQQSYVKNFADADGYIYCNECVVEDCPTRERNKKMEFCLYYTYNHEGTPWR